ncbi:uncharacterized protein EV422DRAFT_596095 [Fimicolochytrium jonesii]|uniref:uncharacterized protein n=1 Tax=Fimicolochytrium jonesii TaxID=1396493 RepID=UPI0022FF290D|nr:uncharacterized protein EV422DRAFT_596095 [Fimicolochytrium jonesii]KAI8820825.1 hypothetical protein EV422DRAFT_596095 [Fimicolochytrium jonesii]
MSRDTQKAPQTTGSQGEEGGEEDEWEEETKYVVLDLGTEVDAETVQAAAAKYEGLSIIGLDTATPVLRIGNMVFKGALDRTLGTDLIFSKSNPNESRPKRAPQGPMPMSMDPSRADIDMTFIGTSSLKAKFKRVDMVRKPDRSSPMDVDPPTQ